MNADSASLFFRKLIDTLLGEHRTATVTGAVSGIAVQGVVDLTSATWATQVPLKLDFAKLTYVHYVSGGVVIALAISGLSRLVRRNPVPQDIRDKLALIQELRKQSNLSESEIRTLYRDLYRSVLDVQPRQPVGPGRSASI